MYSDPVKKRRLFLVSACANLITFSVGTSVGWTSPILPKLSKHTEDSPLANPITPAEQGWIGSLLAIGALIMVSIAGPIGAKIGKKMSMLAGSVLLMVSYILLLVASELWMIYLARILQGATAGLSLINLIVYVAEISTDNIRGALGSFMTIFMAGGVLFVYSIGPWVSYKALQWCCLMIPILFFVSFVFMPESPYNLAQKGRKKDLLKCLQFLRGHTGKAIEDEMHMILISIDKDAKNKGSLLEIFRNRGYLKALTICCGLVIFEQLSGSTAVTYNSQSIFDSVHSTLDPAVATIILALTHLISNMLTPFVVEKAGRKIVLLISILSVAVSLFALGAFFYVQAFGDETNILWLPVLALIVFNITYSFGFAPIPWIIFGEIFPSEVKTIAMSIVGTCSWATSFLVTRFFPELNALGAFYAFWLFGSLCLVAVLFVLFVVIETKGLSLQQIQEKLRP